MTTAQLAQRLEALEKEVAEIKAQLASALKPSRRWWVEGAGRFANDAVFDDIVRLGREYRASLRPGKGQRRRDRP